MNLLDKPVEIFGVSFASPVFLPLLLLIPLISYLRGLEGGAPAIIFSSGILLKKLGSRRESARGWFRSGLLYLALAAFILGLARPQKGEAVIETTASGIDIIIALDVSKSMLAEDFTIGGRNANRLDAVKRVTRDFIQGRPNDRIGMVAFAGRPYLVSPLTLDHDWLIRNLDRVQIGLVEDGTAIGSAISSSANRLRDRDSKSRLIVLLTDGDNNAGKIQPVTAAEAANALGIKIYAIGAGSRGYARIPLQDPFGRTIYQNVRVDFDESTLKQIAATTNGEYFRATGTESLEEIFRKIDEFEKTDVEVKRYTNFTELFPLFVGAGLIMLAAEFTLSSTFWRRVP